MAVAHAADGHEGGEMEGRPTSPYTSLHLPISPYISLHLPISPYADCSQAAPADARQGLPWWGVLLLQVGARGRVRGRGGEGEGEGKGWVMGRAAAPVCH